MKVHTPPETTDIPAWKTLPLDKLKGESYTRRQYFEWGIAAALGQRTHILAHMKPSGNCYTEHYRDGYNSAIAIVKKERKNV